jgi:hypothetical protein
MKIRDITDLFTLTVFDKTKDDFITPTFSDEICKEKDCKNVAVGMLYSKRNNQGGYYCEKHFRDNFGDEDL